MNLEKKLVLRSNLLFLITTMLITSGTYFLYRYSSEDAYRKRLLAIAQLAGEFYLEKDEVTAVSHARIERKFNKISDETILLYNVVTKSFDVSDPDTKLPMDNILKRTKKGHPYSFKEGNRRFLSLFYEDNEGNFIIVVSGIDTEGGKRSIMLVQMLALFGCIGLALHFVLTRILANRTFKPFAKLITEVNAIKGDDWQTRLDYPGKSDEINQFVMEFNYLLDRLETSFSFQRNFFRNASHEIKTPLAIIIGDIEVALTKTRSGEEYQQLLQSLKANSLHLKSIVESLLTLSNLEITGNHLKEKIRIDEVLWEILDKKGIEYPGRKAIVEFPPETVAREELLQVEGTRHLLFIALNNIIDNAFKFSSYTPVKISLGVENDFLRMVISDSGIGIAEDEKENIFNLFYRSPKSNHIAGHGIGLYLSKQIFSLNNVDITVQSDFSEGTRFILDFNPMGTSQ